VVRKRVKHRERCKIVKSETPSGKIWIVSDSCKPRPIRFKINSSVTDFTILHLSRCSLNAQLYIPKIIPVKFNYNRKKNIFQLYWLPLQQQPFWKCQTLKEHLHIPRIVPVKFHAEIDIKMLLNQSINPKPARSN
jgi:hypothetical protein